MTRAEFESVRSELGVHAVVPGHEQRGRQEVVGRSDRYILVRQPAAAAPAPAPGVTA
jgi:hypothetical protein